MPRELITIQVGQCGNQVGSRFWDLALREHAANNPRGVFDEPLSAFFRNVDSRYDDPAEIPCGSGALPIRTLKARAILVDMEEGVLAQLARSQLADLFDVRQRITSSDGAGNNWAHGHEVDGPRHAEELLEVVRRAVGFCDSLQCFSLVHSLGGGTGSGVGTFLLPLLADEYPHVFRFVTCLLPAENDDVITSPYNTVLALDQLIEHADCVLPADNGALAALVARAAKQAKPSPGGPVAPAAPVSTVANGGAPGARLRAFDEMNNVVGGLLSNLTAGMRFDGSLNVDLNEITTNLVPFPRLHFLLPAMAPLSTPRAGPAAASRVDQMFSDVFSKEALLLDVRRGGAGVVRPRTLAAAVLVRGDVAISDVARNLSRLGPSVDMASWNEGGFKVGLCRVPPAGQPRAVLGLFNSTAIAGALDEQRGRFDRLFKRRAHLHHYTEFMAEAELAAARENLVGLVAEYEAVGSAAPSAQVDHPLDRAVPLR